MDGMTHLLSFGAEEFYKRFDKFIQLFQESDFNENYLNGEACFMDLKHTH